MSQISNENENGKCSGDFVQFDEPDKVPDQQEVQQHDGKMEQLKDDFANMLSTQNEQHQMEMDGNGKRAIDGNQMKLDSDSEGDSDSDSEGDELTIKDKIIVPKGFVWNRLKTRVNISQDGLKATIGAGCQFVFATDGYPIPGEQCRKNNFPFPGTFVYYYEVTESGSGWLDSFGFSDGNAGGNTAKNTYAIQLNGCDYDKCWLAGKPHEVEYPGEAGSGVIVGAGLLLNKNGLAVFFTSNGKLLGKPAPINPTVDCLYPTVYICADYSVVANFGNNLDLKPFKFDIGNCPGLDFE